MSDGKRRPGTVPDDAGSLIVTPFDTTQITSKANRSHPRPGAPSHPLAAGAHPPAIAYRTSGNCGAWETGDQVDTLTTGTDRASSVLSIDMAVRRLTVQECERLQGFPDGWTAIRYRGKPAADGPRYKAIGNSMAVPVMRWIGERIMWVESQR
jgi:DNA (cytosine-5)-methyltransferase 1